MKNKVLVIGGSGFVGTRLIEIINNSPVINLDKRPSMKFNEITSIGNIIEKSKIKKYFVNVDVVVLLAAEHRDDVSPKSLYYDVNVKGTENVLQIMDEFGIKKIIFTSSVAVYGLNKNNPNEESPLNPFNDYGKSKALAEKKLKNWYDSDPKNKSLFIVRPSVIFGESNRGNVHNLMKQISKNRFVMIGDGKNKKSMVYIGNIIHFLNQLINTKENGFFLYNYVDKPDYNMNDLVMKINQLLNRKSINIKIPYIIGLIIAYLFDIVSILTNKKLPFSSIRLKKFCATTVFDSKKMNSVFTPPYSMSDGLKNTIMEEFSKGKV